MTKNLVKKTTLPFLSTSLIILVIHGSLVNLSVFPDYNLSFWWLIYAGLIPISLLGLGLIAHVYNKTKKVSSIGKNYMLYTFVKMVFSLLILLPWLINKDETSKPMVAQFFLVFFPFLLVETILLVKLLNTSFDEKNKNE
jgi:hypothetical protein